MVEKSSELTISQEESIRIRILKVWLTIMVIFIHSYNTNVNFVGKTIAFSEPVWLFTIKCIISKILSRSAVPAFFFLAAYFLYRKQFSWKKNITKKIRSLLFPYFILNALWIFIFFVAQKIPSTRSFFATSENIIANWSFADWIANFFGSPSSSYPILYPLWFIRDLFVLNLLSFVFDWIVKKFGHISFAIFLLVWLFLYSTHIFFLNVQSLCFWGIGCYFARQRISISVLDKYKVIIAIAYPCLSIITYFLLDNSGIWALFIYRLCSLVGIAFWFVCTTKIKGKFKTIILFISKYSFCIYLFHEMNLTILRKIIAKFVPQTPFVAVFFYFVIPVIIIALCVLLSWLLEKYTPKVYKIISGGRSR